MSVSLTTTDHSRDAAGLKYVYPVISRRSGGLSIGVNVNTNNACNWRCVYCQVPGLIRGSAPEIDLDLLRGELQYLLQEVQHGDFYQRFGISADNRRIRDIAISGNGEPTSVEGFERVVSLIATSVADANLTEQPELVLITNGSLVHQQQIQRGLRLLNDVHGQIWFKLDSATKQGRIRINGAAIAQHNCLDNLLLAARLCPTWLQTCLFLFDNQPPDAKEMHAYLTVLAEIISQVELQGVLLYTLARPSIQPEAERLGRLSAEQLQYFAEAIRALGVTVKVSP